MWQPGWQWGLGENGYMYMLADSLYCSPETITALLIGYNPQYEIKRFEKNYHNTVSWLYSNIE